MNNRILFLIYNNEVKYLQNSSMDHREWFLSLGGKQEEYDQLIRGFIMDGKVLFFKGPEFKYDNEVYETARKFAHNIRSTLNNNNLVICCGILPGLPGQKWEPILVLNENEIETYVEKPIKVPEKKEIKEFHQEPVLEFKNNYEDEKFIKVATTFTIVILILTVLAKVILITTKKLNPSSFGEILLILAQVLTLLGTIYGYKKKKEFTKYLSLLAAISIILTFDLFDIIIGIIYFIFSVDQGYFVSLGNFIKEKIKK